VEEILKLVDMNQNGDIDFTEFVLANTPAKSLLSDNNLISAFTMFDADGNERITLNDLQSVFKNKEENVEQMFAEADEQGLGEIPFSQFKQMMLGLVNREDSSPLGPTY